MLSPPEAFLATMSTVPRLMDKINLLILIQQFEVLWQLLPYCFIHACETFL